jgi:hypothetical protein
MLNDDAQVGGMMQLDYAGPSTSSSPWGNWLMYRVVLVMGIAPTIFGTLVFAVWVITRNERLFPVGEQTINVGTVIVAIGGVLLVVFAVREWFAHYTRKRWIIRRLLWGGLVLLMNFPLAAAYIGITLYLMSFATVTVVNAGSKTVESFVVKGAGVNVEMGPIRPGGSVTRQYRIGQDSAVTFLGRKGERKLTGVIDGYQQAGPTKGSYADIVTIDDDGKASVTQKRRR